VRDIPSPDAAGSEALRPVAAVLLLAALVGGGFLAATAFDGDGGGTTVEVTVTPAAAADGAASYPAGAFAPENPIREAVERAAETGDRVRTTATVDDPGRVKLSPSDGRRSYRVRLDGPGEDADVYRVTVAVRTR
jgi:hypothetical protein